MTELLDSAAQLLETAMQCQGGQEWTVLAGADGGLEMIAGAGHPLQALAASRGATWAWQVRRRPGAVRVEASGGGRRCLVESPAPGPAVRRVLGDVRLYELAV